MSMMMMFSHKVLVCTNDTCTAISVLFKLPHFEPCHVHNAGDRFRRREALCRNLSWPNIPVSILDEQKSFFN